MKYNVLKNISCFPHTIGLILNLAIFAAFAIYSLEFSYQYRIYAEYQTKNVQNFEVVVKHGDNSEQKFTRRIRNSTGEEAGLAAFYIKSREEAIEFKPYLVFKSDDNHAAITKITVSSKWSSSNYVHPIPDTIPLNISALRGGIGDVLSFNWIYFLFSITFTFLLIVFNKAIKLNNENCAKIIILTSFSVFLSLIAKEMISERNIYGDGVIQLRAAYNIAHFNIFSHQLSPTPIKSNFIEPLPAFINGLYIKVLMLTGHSFNFNDLRDGSMTLLLKQINVLWIFIGLTTFILFAWKVSQKMMVSLFSTFMVALFFFSNRLVIDTFYTELQTSVLLLIASISVFFFVGKPSFLNAIITGLFAGLLVLTKAVFLYINLIALVIVIFLAFFNMRHIGTNGKLIIFKISGAMILVYFMVIGSWMTRNYTSVESFSISDRGGSVLFGRATLNQMTEEEVRGAFYLYGPRTYQLLGAYIPYALATDVQLDPNNGTWVRVNRNFSNKSFFAELRPFFRSEFQRPDEYGNPRSENEVFKDLQIQALQKIKSEPVKHMSMSFVFLWRGMWNIQPIDFFFIKRHHDFIITELVMLLVYLSSLIMIIISVIRKHHAFLGFAIFATGGVAFYSLLSHFLPRYMLPMHPIFFLMLGFLMSYVLDTEFFKKLKRLIGFKPIEK